MDVMVEVKQQEIEAARLDLAQHIKKRLAKPRIDILDARDGMRDCFVSSYLGGVSQGLEQFDIKGTPDTVSKVVENMFRRRLTASGASWNNPTAEALQIVKDELDEETHLDELPAELKGVHDQVCTLLIGKARGDLNHFGDTSAVREEQALTVESPVIIALRSAITAQLEHMVLISEQTNDVTTLHELLAQQSGKLEQLLDTAQSFQASA